MLVTQRHGLFLCPTGITSNDKRAALLLKGMLKMLVSIMYDNAQDNLPNSNNIFEELATLQLLIGFIGWQKPTFTCVLNLKAHIQTGERLQKNDAFTKA